MSSDIKVGVSLDCTYGVVVNPVQKQLARLQEDNVIVSDLPDVLLQQPCPYSR